MLLQLSSILSTGFGSLLTGVSGLVREAIPLIAQTGTAIGAEYLKGLVQKELNRDVVNAQQDAIKAAVRSAANAVSPIAAPGNVAVGSGGPAIGSAFLPTVFTPTSISSARLTATAVNPNFAQVSPALPVSRDLVPRTGTPDFFGLLRGFPSLPSNLGLPQVMGADVPGPGIDPLSIDRFGRPTVPGALSQRINGTMANGTMIPAGLPAVGRFQKNAMGQVQWFFFDGQQMLPVDRAQAKECLQKGCLYRLDVFKGRYLKLGSRRMNPMNIKAFFRAGRRIDAAERLCRKMYSEKRKQKTGTMRRKSKTRKK
jgi:hypothetical protein